MNAKRLTVAGWHCGCRERRSLRCFRRVSKLLDECARWVWRCQRAAGQHQSDRGNVESGTTPESTLKLLLMALGAGSVVLLPSLFYLFQIFKRQEQRW